eukprot:m.106366 g.106366  ORF g.106366 m.106366 type:complete len:396 (+) comp16897_c0_seq1:245-1432(+)
MGLVNAFESSFAGNVPTDAVLEKLRAAEADSSCSLEFRGESALDPQLRGYKLTSDDVQALCSALTNEPTAVKELHLVNLDVSDADCPRIAELVAKNRTLEVLNLSGSDISPAGLSLLAPAIAQSQTLKGFIVRGCKVGDGKGMEMLVDGLCANASSVLEELDVSNTDLSIDALIQLRTLVCQQGTSLKKLLMDRPLLKGSKNDFAPHVGDILKHARTLEHLSVRHFGFTDEGMEEIADGLTRSNVCALDLGCNRIGRGGATLIAAALRTNTALKKLLIDHNHIQDEGLLALCEALLQTSGVSLEVLDVSFNAILGSVGHKTGHLHQSGLVYLAQTIASTPSITEFYIWGNPAVSAVGQLDDQAALLMGKLLASGGYRSDVCAYEVDGVFRLALQN